MFYLQNCDYSVICTKYYKHIRRLVMSSCCFPANVGYFHYFASKEWLSVWWGDGRSIFEMYLFVIHNSNPRHLHLADVGDYL